MGSWLQSKYSLICKLLQNQLKLSALLTHIEEDKLSASFSQILIFFKYVLLVHMLLAVRHQHTLLLLQVPLCYVISPASSLY